VLDRGCTIAGGAPDDVTADRAVVDAYLGTAA
jgi:ABC-type branched-subunit amino acid transport system ATPase component